MRIHSSLLGIALLSVVIVVTPAFATESNEDLDGLNEQIDEKSEVIEDLTTKLHTYQQQVLEKQDEEATLENEISLLDLTLEETETKIQKTETELDVTQTEIEIIHDQIKEAENTIGTNKKSLTELIREINKNEQKSPVEVAFAKPTFSEFYSRLEYTNRIQTDVQSTVDRLQRIKNDLEDKREELKDKKAQVALQKNNLEHEQGQLQEQQEYKEQLLEETQLSEEKFQTLLDGARAEHAQIEAEIAQLTQEAQDKLSEVEDDTQEELDKEEEQEVDDEEEQDQVGSTRFDWPLRTGIYVTCEFHCPAYPFYSAIGEHSGIDIRAAYRTPIYAAGSGTVTRIKFDPNSSSLGYIFIDHGNGLATMYLHISSYAIQPYSYVRKGELIGYSGGVPGTPGAGLSTAAHLHFEVRLNGIAVNPRPYLP